MGTQTAKTSRPDRDFDEMREEVLHELQDGGIADIPQEEIDYISNEIIMPHQKKSNLH
jgi:hypothetical protein